MWSIKQLSIFVFEEINSYACGLILCALVRGLIGLRLTEFVQ